MATFEKDGKILVITRVVEVKEQTSVELLSKRRMELAQALQALEEQQARDRANLQGQLDEVNALLAEADKLGMIELVEAVSPPK